MKGKKKKEDGISSEIPEKKKPPRGGRLSGMIESMQKRGSPVNAHRVATAYFDSFRKERNIAADPGGEPASEDGATAVDTGEYSTVVTAVDNAVKGPAPKKKPPGGAVKAGAGQKDPDAALNPSELKVYGAIYKVCAGRGSEGLRLGLKELRDLTGLSDKTVRVAIHSLVEKLNIEIVGPPLGVYGRKYRVYAPGEVRRRRETAGMVIEEATKKVLYRKRGASTAVSNAVSSPVESAVITAVGTAVTMRGADIDKKKQAVASLYQKYTGNEWGRGDDVSCDSIINLDIGVIETGIILCVLKGEGGARDLADVIPVLRTLGKTLPDGYLENLREVWKRIKESDRKE